MDFRELDRDEYLYSAKRIGDYNTLKFSKFALECWDDYYSWEKFPPIVLSIDGVNKSYLFYNISKDNRYLTINYLFTPKNLETRDWHINFYLSSSVLNPKIILIGLKCFVYLRH